MIAVVIVGVVVVLVGLVLTLMFNGLIRARNLIENAWSQIEVQLKRRHDLIPNLVETVKGYAAHERGTFEAVTQARANAINAGQSGSLEQRAQTENALTGTLKTLFAVSEAYPALKANQNFMALQTELGSTEDRIAFSRQFYNDAVLVFNTKIQAAPTNLIAARLHFTAREYFSAEPEAQAPVIVKF